MKKNENTLKVMEKEMKGKKILHIIPIMVGLILVGWISWFHGDRLLDSDMASELILGRLLAEENAILSTNWFYSTELRVLNTQLIYSFFFKIFSDWTVIRTASILTMLMILMLVIFYFSKVYKCDAMFGILGCLFLLPISEDYFNIVLHGAYYIPHIAISVLTLTLIEHFYISKNKIVIICLGLLALLAGMGGPRQILILYIPLGITAVVTVAQKVVNDNLKFRDKDKIYDEMLVYGVPCVFSIIGYEINSQILSKYYSFKKYELYWREVTFYDVQSLVQGLLEAFGYSREGITLGSTLCVLASGLWIVYTFVTVISEARKKEDSAKRRLSIFLISAYSVFWILYLFTSMDFLSRYYIPLIVFSFPLLVLNVMEKGKTKRDWWLKKIGVFLMILSAVNSFKTYQDIANLNVTYFKKEAMNVLCDCGIMNGYATFWNANVLTELSDGDIEVWTWPVETSLDWPKMKSVDEIYGWLQVKSHKVEKPEGKVFILLSNAEYNSSTCKASLDTIPYFWKNDEYWLWVFESYDDMVKQLQFIVSVEK